MVDTKKCTPVVVKTIHLDGTTRTVSLLELGDDYRFVQELIPYPLSFWSEPGRNTHVVWHQEDSVGTWWFTICWRIQRRISLRHTRGRQRLLKRPVWEWSHIRERVTEHRDLANKLESGGEY